MPPAKAGKRTFSKPPPKKTATKPSRRTGKKGPAKGKAVKVKIEAEIEEAVNVKTEVSAVKIKTEELGVDCPPRKRALVLRSSSKENISIAIDSKKIKVEKGILRASCTD